MPTPPEDFERELLLHLIAQPDLGKAFSKGKLETRDFKKPWMQSIWGAAANHYKTYNEWPSPGMLFLQVATLYDGENLKENERPLVDGFFQDIHGRTEWNPAYYRSECERFIENRRASKVYDRACKGQLSVDDVITELSSIRTQTRSHHLISVDPFDKILLNEAGKIVETSISSLDFRLPGGGHMEKRTMLIIGFTSSGKSTILRTIEAGAAMRKQRVLSITLEDSATEVAEKLYANVAGIPATLLRNEKYRTPQMVQRIEQCRDILKGYIKIIDPYDPDTNSATNAKPVTPLDLELMVDRELQLGYPIDLVTIDYLNRIKIDHKDTKMDESQALRLVSEQLKDRIAKRFKLPVITCGQASGEGFDKAILQIVDMARSKEAAWAFDVIATLGSPRKLETHFNNGQSELGDADEEEAAINEARKLTHEDLMMGRCPLKMVQCNLAKVRGGMTGRFPLYADFCYGRFAEPGGMINTIIGPRNVDEVRDEQIQANKAAKP